MFWCLKKPKVCWCSTTQRLHRHCPKVISYKKLILFSIRDRDVSKKKFKSRPYHLKNLRYSREKGRKWIKFIFLVLFTRFLVIKIFLSSSQTIKMNTFVLFRFFFNDFALIATSRLGESKMTSLDHKKCPKCLITRAIRSRLKENFFSRKKCFRKNVCQTSLHTSRRIITI